jgi:hypothetical protein
MSQMNYVFMIGDQAVDQLRVTRISIDVFAQAARPLQQLAQPRRTNFGSGQDGKSASLAGENLGYGCAKKSGASD